MRDASHQEPFLLAPVPGGGAAPSDDAMQQCLTRILTEEALDGDIQLMVSLLSSSNLHMHCVLPSSPDLCLIQHSPSASPVNAVNAPHLMALHAWQLLELVCCSFSAFYMPCCVVWGTQSVNALTRNITRNTLHGRVQHIQV